MPQKVSNPPNPWSKSNVEWLDEPPDFELQVYKEKAKSIIAHNDSPDVGFSFSINPYRGCFHGCAYCYARPTHHYIDFGAGTDFERKIVAKINAPQLLKTEFEKKSWEGETIVFSGVTDCYQPLEANFELTKQCLEVCLNYRNPVAIITKGALIRRDMRLLAKLHEVAEVKVIHSIAFGDDDMSRSIEPYAPRPSIRFRAMRELHEAGIPLAVGVAPIIPGLNDSQIPAILERAYENGARSAFMTLVRLPKEVKEVFAERLKTAFPTRYLKVLHQLSSMKQGLLNRSEFGVRMRGEGPQWEATKWLFKSTCEKLGMNAPESKPEAQKSTFARPSAQLNLF